MAENQEPINNESQINAYLDTEFLFYMFPCYYAVAAFIYRYFNLLEIQKLYYVKPIFLEEFFSSILENNDTNQAIKLPYKKLTPSFLIKYKVSLWNSLLYLIMIVLSFATSPDLFYASKHKNYSLLYLFGALSWYLSAFIIKKQYERDINQSLWTHRFFWIFCSVFSITKMFEDYFLPINVIVNSLFLVINIQMAIYGLYRPEDNDTVEMIRSQDTPQFIKKFFATLELNSYIRVLFGIEDYSRQSFADNQWYKDQINQQNVDEQKIKEIQATFSAKKQTAQTIKQQINLMNTLPRRNIFIDKKLRYKKENQKYKSYYFILTQIGDARFEAQRKNKQFSLLQAQLLEVFNSKNFPKNQAPKIMDIVKKNMSYSTPINSLPDISEEFAGKAQILQQWLQQIIKQPLFMIKPLLNFLKIDQQKSAPFITYFQFTHKSFCTKTFLISKYAQQKTQQQDIRRSLMGYYQVQDPQAIAEKEISIKKMITSKLQFNVTVNKQVTEEKEYGFWITCLSAQKGKIKWMIRKYEENILQLNQKVQDQCKLSVPFYYKILSNMTNVSHKAKAAAYREYIEKLLQTDKYYCISLFQFVRFDPIKIEPKLLNTQMSFSQIDLFGNEKQMQSRYFQMWDDKGEFIEVLRLDKLSPQATDVPVPNQFTQPVGPDEYKFTVRRKGTTLRNKRTKQLENLREKLYNLYKGINNVPILDLKDCTKQQIKNRIQNFLLKIESLPKIQINKDYKKFYQNSL